MAQLFPDLENICRLTVSPTKGEMHLVTVLQQTLSDDFEIFFNPYLDGDRPDIIILKAGFGAAVIEIKDWELVHYRIDILNTWHYQEVRLRSPQQQAFRYKDNLFNLHLPVLGLKELSNRNFYNVISAQVYFHNASRDQLNQLYAPALLEVGEKIRQLNGSREDIGQVSYDKQMDFWESKRYQLNRDLAMAWSSDTLTKKIKRIAQLNRNFLFSDDVYLDFRRRLAPPVHTERQGTPMPFDIKQLPLTVSAQGLSKIRGVAGCGKTSILAQRAINAHARHRGQVLILTFNITLRHTIRDTISRLKGSGADNSYEIIHYHGFINGKINEYGIDVKSLKSLLPESNRGDPYGIYQLISLFDGIQTEKIQTILIDEIQDYEPEWIKIIKNNFLDPISGEMVLFGDLSQNIYDRPANLKGSSIAPGFGRWQKLTRSYRSRPDALLIELFKCFQEKYLSEKYEDSAIFEATYQQGSMKFDLLAYESYGAIYDANFVLQRIQYYIRVHKLHPNDIAIVSSQVEYIFPINEALKIVEKTKVMFEESEELDIIDHASWSDHKTRKEEIEKIRRRKKTFFMQNSGLIKISTIHSFKGHEAETVFCILSPEDVAEMVYTGITRAQKNLVVFDGQASKFGSFFLSHV